MKQSPCNLTTVIWMLSIPKTLTRDPKGIERKVRDAYSLKRLWYTIFLLHFNIRFCLFSLIGLQYLQRELRTCAVCHVADDELTTPNILTPLVLSIPVPNVWGCRWSECISDAIECLLIFCMWEWYRVILFWFCGVGTRHFDVHCCIYQLVVVWKPLNLPPCSAHCLSAFISPTIFGIGLTCSHKCWDDLICFPGRWCRALFCGYERSETEIITDHSWFALNSFLS